MGQGRKGSTGSAWLSATRCGAMAMVGAGVHVSDEGE